MFCEVKTRRTERFGAPVEAVSWSKAARLRRLAAAWLQEHEVRGGRIRIDVIGVLRPESGPAAAAARRRSGVVSFGRPAR